MFTKIIQLTEVAVHKFEILNNGFLILKIVINHVHLCALLVYEKMHHDASLILSSETEASRVHFLFKI